MNRSQRLLTVFIFFGIIAGLGYWIYLYLSTGSAPSISDLWGAAQGGFTSVTGIGKLDFGDLQTFATTAGFSGSDADTAAAIALAESSGNPNAVGDLALTPGGSVGLWQINLKAHPEYTNVDLTDPQTNANAAYAIFQASGFGAWSTYNSGAYQQYMPTQEVPSVDGGDDGE